MAIKLSSAKRSKIQRVAAFRAWLTRLDSGKDTKENREKRKAIKAELREYERKYAKILKSA